MLSVFHEVIVLHINVIFSIVFILGIILTCTSWHLVTFNNGVTGTAEGWAWR